MRPKRLVLILALGLLLLAPLATFAGKGGGGGGGGSGIFPEGDYAYLDRISGDKIKTVASIDQEFGEFCIEALIVYIDTTNTLNRRVEFLFHSLGDIARQDDERVDGVFGVNSVDVTLTVYDGPETTDTVLFTGTANPPCDLDARLTQGGERLKAQLRCELGPNLEVKGNISEDILDSIAFALAKKKSVKIDVDSGRFQVNNNGFEVDPIADGLDFSLLDCPTSSDNED